MGSGPSHLECSIFLGHAGVSMDYGSTIHGFNPEGAGLPVWQIMEKLRMGERLSGVVRDDATVFATVKSRGLTLETIDFVLPEPAFADVQRALDGERQRSQYAYGFPDGDGDCNCITWLERLGLPLHTGRMNEFLDVPWLHLRRNRKFGRCL